MRTSPLEVEQLTPHFTVPVSLRCPQGTGLPTLPPRVLQGAAVSGERISEDPPGNLVAWGCPPPLRRVLERSAQTLPVGSLVQDIILTAQIHTNPETSLERLVPIVEFDSVEISAKYISLGPADYRKWVSNTVRVSPSQVHGGFVH